MHIVGLAPEVVDQVAWREHRHRQWDIPVQVSIGPVGPQVKDEVAVMCAGLDQIIEAPAAQHEHVSSCICNPVLPDLPDRLVES